jgi:hypothetical protein
MTPGLLLSVDRVTLVEPGGPWLSAEAWIWLVFFAFASIAVGGFVSIQAWRDRKATSPEERAFRALVRPFALGRREMGTLKGPLTVPSGTRIGRNSKNCGGGSFLTDLPEQGDAHAPFPQRAAR